MATLDESYDYLERKAVQRAARTRCGVLGCHKDATGEVTVQTPTQASARLAMCDDHRFPTRPDAVGPADNPPTSSEATT